MMISLETYSDNLHSFLDTLEITDKNGKHLDIKEGMSRIFQNLQSVKKTQKKVMITGNGGSAAIASHLHNDLSKSAKIRAMVFTEIPLLTALSNDISYIAAFREQVNLWTDKDDMLISISSSGRSQNLLDAVRTAQEKGCNPVITITGFRPDNPLRSLGDINLYIPSEEYGYVELAHSVLTHYISDQTSKTE